MKNTRRFGKKRDSRREMLVQAEFGDAWTVLYGLEFFTPEVTRRY